MKHLLKLLFVLGIVGEVMGQALNPAWVKQAGSAGDDRGKGICIDSVGNVYTTGYFSGTVDFDPGVGILNLTSSGGRDIYISKFNSTGNFIWAKRIGGTSNDDQSYDIKLDGFGNLIVAGSFGSTVDFDPGIGNVSLVSLGFYDIFVLKLDLSGNFVWVKNMSGLSYECPNAIAIDASGDIVITGYYIQTVDFDPGSGIYNLTSEGNRDIFIVKLNSSGNFIWAKSIGANNDDNAQSVTVDSLGYIYVTGDFNDTTDFDPDAGTFHLYEVVDGFGDGDIFILKLDASGSLVWAKSMGGISKDTGLSIAVDDSGNVFTVGLYSNTVDFDPNLGIYNLLDNADGSTNGGRGYISKLDASGNFVWAKKLGGTEAGRCAANEIVFDSRGNFIVTGFFGGSEDFDPSPNVFNLVGPSGIFIYNMKPLQDTQS